MYAFDLTPMEEYTVYVLEELYVAYINDDYSGVDEDYEEMMKAFLERKCNQVEAIYPTDTLMDDMEANWTKCEVTGEYGHCVPWRWTN